MIGADSPSFFCFKTSPMTVVIKISLLLKLLYLQISFIFSDAINSEIVQAEKRLFFTQIGLHSKLIINANE